MRMWKIFLCYSIFLNPCKLPLEWVTLQLFVVERTIYLWCDQHNSGQGVTLYTFQVSVTSCYRWKGCFSFLFLASNRFESFKPPKYKGTVFQLGGNLSHFPWELSHFSFCVGHPTNARFVQMGHLQRGSIQRKNRRQFQTFLDKPLSPGF